MTSRWFCADLHFGHAKVAGLRGFANTDDHDAAVMAGLRSCLSKGDTLWLLGDLTMGGKHREIAALEALGKFAQERDVTMHLILGNHDRAHPQHTNSARAERDARQYMETVGIARRIKVADGGRALLSHFPYTGDHTATERYTQWRLPDEGMPLIHGHTHSTEKVSHSQAGTVQVCASLDAWNLLPAPQSQVEDLITRHRQTSNHAQESR